MWSWTRGFSIVSLGLAIVAVTAAAVFGPGQTASGPLLTVVLSSAPALSMGLLISWRGTARLVGPFLSSAGLIPAVTVLKDALVAAGRSPGATAEQARLATDLGTATSGGWMLLYLPFALLLLTFPEGRFPSRRWRIVAGALIAVVCAFCLLGAAGQAWVAVGLITLDGFSVVALVLLLCFAGLLVACACSAIARYRSASGTVRQQLRWLALAGIGLPLTLLLGWASELVFGYVEAFDLVLLATYVAIPVTVAIAVLKHDLYDVDRVLLAAAVYSVLIGGVLVVIAATSAVAGLIAGGASTFVMVAVTAGTALALGPARRMAQRSLHRWLFPARERALRALADLLALVQTGRARPEEVEEVLQGAVHDPGLRIGYRAPVGDELVDRGGNPVVRPANATNVRLSDRLIGVLIPGDPAAAPLSKDIADSAAILIEMVRLRMDLAAALAQVESSRERLLRAGYAERRRLEQDLHDGAQQRLVSLGMALRLAQRHLDDEALNVDGILDEAVTELGTAVAELRQIAHGLRPSSLDDGLAAALTNLSRRSSIPVELSIDVGALPEMVSTTAYYVANEAVTNAVKHSAASAVQVSVSRAEESIVVTVADDGCGGAELRPASGLAGLSDRVGAAGGALRVQSPRGRGTIVEAVLPCAS